LFSTFSNSLLTKPQPKPVCHTIGHATNIPGHDNANIRTTPSFACMGDNNNITKGLYTYNYHNAPWNGPNETSYWIDTAKPFFHMISWEYGDAMPHSKRPLSKVYWEHPELVSLLIIRHPIDRLLAKDMFVQQQFPALTDSARKGWNLTRLADRDKDYQMWWEYANSSSLFSVRNTNNFALRVLSYDGVYDDMVNIETNSSSDGRGGGGDYIDYRTYSRNHQRCCRGKDTDRRYLDRAKNLINRFTIVLDQACLNEGMEQLGILLGIKLQQQQQQQLSNNFKNVNFKKLPDYSKPTQSYRERIGYDDVYEFLLEKNKLDIELYEWAASERSLVRCKDLL
jgi:hypothetical protein